MLPAEVCILSMANNFWDWAKGPGARAKNVVQIGSNMQYLSFQLSDWAEIWVVTLFLNYIATSKVEPML